MKHSDKEAQVVEALALMDAARFGTYEVLDVAQAVRQVKFDRDRAHTRLGALEADLNRVAALLRSPSDTLGADACAARETIAAHFTAGALAVAQAHAALKAATNDLAHQRFLVL